MRRWVLAISLLICAGQAVAQTIDFEDAFASLGHGGDPATFYNSLGITISGTYFGILEGVSRGDTGRFNLEGTNGPASLAANDAAQQIDFSFTAPQNSACIDIGTAFFEQEPDGVNLTIKSLLNGAMVEQRNIFIQDSLRAGEGDWRSFRLLDFDRIEISQTSGSTIWAVDNLRLPATESCDQQAEMAEESFFIIPLNNGKVVVVPL